MYDIHPNSKWLIDWSDRMNIKYGLPDSDNDWCRKLAYYCGEAGNDHPSYTAIEVAKSWEAYGFNEFSTPDSSGAGENEGEV